MSARLQENDLFFHYTHLIDHRAFMAVREEQRLMIDFQDYAVSAQSTSQPLRSWALTGPAPPPALQNVLARSLNQAIKEPHTHLAVYIMNRDGNARLDFIQNLDYKFIELLSVTFLRSPEETIRAQISFRYNAMRSKLAVTTARLQEVTNVVKLKNPSLLLALQGKPGAPTPSAASAVGAALATPSAAAASKGPGSTVGRL